MKNRRSIRLQNYDYSQAGAYFVTICTQHRACVLGEVIDDAVQLSPLGQIVEEGWQWLAQRYSYVHLDKWVVMPNHLHGIVLLTDDDRRGGSRAAQNLPRKPLGQLVGAFKTVTTKQINALQNTPAAVFWQRNYHEHVIRNEADLSRLREYIENNSMQWSLDSLHPNFALPS